MIYKQKRCRANYRVPKYSKIDLQTIFWHDFYTIPSQKTLPRPPEPSELPENLEIKSKSTQTFEKKSQIRPSPQKFHPLNIMLCSLYRSIGTLCRIYYSNHRSYQAVSALPRVVIRAALTAYATNTDTRQSVLTWSRS